MVLGWMVDVRDAVLFCAGAVVAMSVEWTVLIVSARRDAHREARRRRELRGR